MEIIKLCNPYNDWVKQEGAFLLPRQLECKCRKEEPRKIAEKLGFTFLGVSEAHPDMWKIDLPKGWTTQIEDLSTISVKDGEGFRRAEIVLFFDRKYRRVIHTIANLFCRYEYMISKIHGNIEIFFTDMKTQNVYLAPKQRRYVSDRIQVIEYEGLLNCIEDDLALEEAYQVLYELNEYFPGWDDPTNWDKNPLEILFK